MELRDRYQQLRSRGQKALRASRAALRRYSGEYDSALLGVSVPARFAALPRPSGWCGVAIDALAERIDLRGLSGEGGSEVWEASRGTFARAVAMATVDALVCGVGITTVERDGDQLIYSALSPADVYADIDGRTGQVKALMSYGEGDEWAADSMSVLSGRGLRERAIPQAVGQPAFGLVNRPRRGAASGRSQITRSMRSIADSAARTLLAMEVSREFYATPQWYVLGVPPDEFGASAEDGWRVVQGHLLALDRDPVTGDKPSVGQFQAASPQPYVEQLRTLAALFAAEAGIPRSYLGLQTDNPSSADAIRAEESRLVRIAEQRLSWWSPVVEAMGAAGAGMLGVKWGARCVWSDPATPTRAAAADAAAKLVGAGIIPAGSDVAAARAGLAPEEIEQVRADRLAEGTAAEQMLKALGA